MSKFQTLRIELFGGVFAEDITFSEHLNIISGENGTGKSELLKELKRRGAGEGMQILALSPKRNIERQAWSQIRDKLNQQRRTLAKSTEELINREFDDNTYSTYENFFESFYSYQDYLVDHQRYRREDAVTQTKDEFNTVLKRVFSGYQIEASWVSGQLELKVIKNGNLSLDFSQLSLGEREVLSLIFTLYTNKNTGPDVYLIDEPEIHLNWSLEESLFKFFYWFTEEYNKQMITVTHSRIVFTEEFKPITQFLVWEGDKIILSKDFSDDIYTKLLGESLSFIEVASFNLPTFFVEDDFQKIVLKSLSKKLGVKIVIHLLGDKPSVIAFARMADSQQEAWKNTYFIIDGDNQGEPLKSPRLFSTDCYCFENLFLKPDRLKDSTGKTEKEIKKYIYDSIATMSEDRNTKVFKKLAESSNPDSFPFDAIDTLNGKNILDKIIKLLIGKQRLTKEEKAKFIDDYISSMNADNLSSTFGDLIRMLKENVTS